MKLQKFNAILIITLIYAVTIIGSIILYNILPINNTTAQNILLKLLIVDASATFFIFILSTIFRNASIYDPYWSVSPMVMGTAFMLIVNNINVWSIILVVLIWIWGLRLTINFLIGFKNIKHQDWRYTNFSNKHPKLFPLINLFGIHLVPTLVVFIAIIPALTFIGDVTKSGYEPTIMTIVSYLIILIAIIIETVADIELKVFKKNRTSQEILQTGLWKNSRHPNYFGECLFWFGLFMAHFSLVNSNPMLVFCPLIVFLLFQFISIPMIDKRLQENKNGYHDYMKRTNRMLPLFPPINK